MRWRPPRWRAAARRPDGGAGPPFTGGAVGFFGYDLVRTVEPLGEPERTGSARAAGHGADADRHAGRVRPSQAHDHDPRQRRPGGASRTSSEHGRRASVIKEVRGAAGRSRPGGGEPAGPRQRRDARVRVEHDPRAVRSDGGADRRVHPRGRRFPGGALPALVGAGAGGGVLDLPRPARGEPQPVHVLPGLRRLPGRGREPRAAADGHRAGTCRHAPIAGTRAARRELPRRIADRARSCWRTRRSAPST